MFLVIDIMFYLKKDFNLLFIYNVLMNFHKVLVYLIHLFRNSL